MGKMNQVSGVRCQVLGIRYQVVGCKIFSNSSNSCLKFVFTSFPIRVLLFFNPYLK